MVRVKRLKTKQTQIDRPFLFLGHGYVQRTDIQLNEKSALSHHMFVIPDRLVSMDAVALVNGDSLRQKIRTFQKFVDLDSEKKFTAH